MSVDRIYFDNNSTTVISDKALENFIKYSKFPLNSNSLHEYGRISSSLINKAKEKLVQTFNAKNYDIIFTNSATEASNTILKGVDVKYIFVSDLEHSSVLNCTLKEKEIIKFNINKDGLVDIDDLMKKIESINSSSFLVCLCLVQSETGSIQPVKEIAKKIHAKNGLIFSDIVQAAGKIPVDLEDLNIDFANISAHKFFGPIGIGALIYRKILDFRPLIEGGGQQNYKRAGTLNIPAIAALEVALDEIKNNIEKQNYVEELRNYFEEKIKKVGEDRVLIYCENIKRVGNTSYFSTKNKDAITQLINFDLNNICVSVGSACSSGLLQTPKVLKAMNVSEDFINSSIRVSLSPQNKIEEVDKMLEVWKNFLNNN